jgi:hypothetical protein
VSAQTTSGRPDAARTGRLYRGSQKRLRRIRLRGNWSVELWLLLAWVAFLLLVVLPWMVQDGR